LTTISIVAIHGKGAHPVKTWGGLRAPGVGKGVKESWIDWLEDKDMLPTVFPAARILRYGYRSDWFGEDALKTRASSIAEMLLDQLEQFRKDGPDRPLIFVAHSFGGLVLIKV
jgi:predicted alpha/beta hydrolase family esterase